MPRLVRHALKGPIRVEPQDKPIFVCACGLSKNFPFCDGTHKGCTTEQDGTLYVYGPDGKVVEERPETA